MMFCWTLISLFVGSLKAQENPEVIYAQVGGTVTLPRQVLDEDHVYVNWYRGADELPAIMRNPQGGIQKEKEMKTHAELLPDFSLKITSVKDSDFVIWRCEQYIFTKKVEKTYKLYHVTIPKVPTLMVGGSLSLECKVDSTPVYTKVTWIPPKNPDCDLKEYNSKTHRIAYVSRCHEGVWTCKLEYGGKRTEATTTVTVIDLSSSPDTIYTAYPSSSSTVNIPCLMSYNIPWSDLRKFNLTGGNWTFTPLTDQRLRQSLLNLSIGQVVRWDSVKTSEEMLTVKGRELKDNDLSIHNLDVSEKIRGDYSCNLMFSAKTLSRKVKVEVLILSSSARSPVYEGNKVNLTCTLGYEHSSDLEVKWNCSSCSYVSSLKSPHPSFLYIPEVKLKDKGKYTCELWKNGKKLTYAMLFLKTEKAPVDIWLFVAISGGVVGFILLVVIIIIFIRKRRQMMIYRRRKTKFCCCKNPQKNQKGFYKT